MVVECGKCGTRFQLDASRIPDDGIRVRCSRCKHAFFLQHPSTSRAKAVDSVVQQAVERVSAPPSTGTRDLSARGLASQVATAASGFAGSEDEEEWEFNQDPIADDESSDQDPIHAHSDSGIDFDLESDSEGYTDESDVDAEYESDDIGLADTDAETAMNPGSRSGFDVHEMGADDLAPSSMGVDDDDIDLDADDAEDEVATGPAPGFGGTREEDAFGSMDEYDGPGNDDVLQQPVATVAKSESENIEDPESWDFFGDGGTPRTAPRGLDTPKRREEARTASADTNPALNLDADSEWRAFERQGPVGAISRIAGALMSVAVFGTLLIGIYLGVVGSFDPGVRTPAFVNLGQMRAANVRGNWVETEHLGTVYVVTGDLLNPGTVGAVPDRGVRVTPLDGDGNVLSNVSTFAGSGLKFDTLRQISRADLRSAQLEAARTLATQQIAPGESMRIAAAFVNLPTEAVHFAIDGAEAQAFASWLRELGGDEGVGAALAATELTPANGSGDAAGERLAPGESSVQELEGL